MRIFFTLLLTLGISLFALAQTEKEISDHHRITEVYQVYKSADARLNNTYRALLEKYSADTVFIENLRTVQRLWIKYRDAQLDLHFPEKADYEITDTVKMVNCRHMFLAELSNQRASELRKLLDVGTRRNQCEQKE